MNDKLVDAIRKVQENIHERNLKWWTTEKGKPKKRNKGECLMLMVSELAECMEGERKEVWDDKLRHRLMAEVELADTVIRILDYASHHGYDIGGAMQEKLAYNDTREDHTWKSRKSKGGKKW